MILAVIFGALVSSLIQGTVSYDDCKTKNFEPKACNISKVMDQVGK